MVQEQLHFVQEYLPILNKYKAMPEYYMKYSIDKQLKKFESALVNISKCEDMFDECLELVQENRLYKQALQLFSPDSQQFKVNNCPIYLGLGIYTIMFLYTDS